jgi:uncharacterized membrane protein
MPLESNKNLGGIGAILMFIGVLPYINFYGITALVGLMLVLTAMYGFANYYKESGIFNNALYGVITAIVGGVIFTAILLTVAVRMLAELGLYFENVADWPMILTQMDWQNIGFNVLMDFATYILLDLVILYVFAIIAALILRKSLGLMSTKTGVGMFGITGILMLVGAVIPIIGFVLIWISLLLLAVAFFSIRPQQAPPPPPTQV